MPINSSSSLYLNILPLPQQRLWAELKDVPPEFVLYGGTAVALHLGHRESVDFDFFGNQPFGSDEFLLSTPFLKDATITQREPNTLSCVVNRDGPVKLSFFGVPNLHRLDPPFIATDNGLQIASLLDLAGTKMSVVQMRAEAKDYLDIDAILTDGRIDLSTALASACAIFGEQFNPQITLKALSYFDDGNVKLLQQDLKDRIRQAVQDVDLNNLPNIFTPEDDQNNIPEP